MSENIRLFLILSLYNLCRKTPKILGGNGKFTPPERACHLVVENAPTVSFRGRTACLPQKKNF